MPSSHRSVRRFLRRYIASSLRPLTERGRESKLSDDRPASSILPNSFSTPRTSERARGRNKCGAGGHRRSFEYCGDGIDFYHPACCSPLACLPASQTGCCRQIKISPSDPQRTCSLARLGNQGFDVKYTWNHCDPELRRPVMGIFSPLLY